MNLRSSIARAYQEDLLQELSRGGKILIVYGPRQVGKTTLSQEVLKHFPGAHLTLNGDFGATSLVLASQDGAKLADLIEGYDLLFIDEAQRIPDIGINLKILHDQFPDLRILVTGSSSLELANKTKEPLTGRTLTYQLHPISIFELVKLHTRFEIQQQRENHMIYGMYPEILSVDDPKRKVRYLKELVSSYLYKDMLELADIRHSNKLIDLLTLLALQIGAQVSLNELGRNLGLAKETVESYLDLLEKAFVIFKLPGFSRNLRKEVTKMSKYYFVDLGVRNVLLQNFNPMILRSDAGSIWENFLISERRKSQDYKFAHGHSYFWRTYDQQEIDYLEDADGHLSAYEIKLAEKSKRVPKAWSKAYPQASFSTITTQNYLDFLI